MDQQYKEGLLSCLRLLQLPWEMSLHYDTVLLPGVMSEEWQTAGCIVIVRYTVLNSSSVLRVFCFVLFCFFIDSLQIMSPVDDTGLEGLDPKGCPPLGHKSHSSYRVSSDICFSQYMSLECFLKITQFLLL